MALIAPPGHVDAGEPVGAAIAVTGFTVYTARPGTTPFAAYHIAVLREGEMGDEALSITRRWSQFKDFMRALANDRSDAGRRAFEAMPPVPLLLSLRRSTDPAFLERRRVFMQEALRRATGGAVLAKWPPPVSAFLLDAAVPAAVTSAQHPIGPGAGQSGASSSSVSPPTSPRPQAKGRPPFLAAVAGQEPQAEDWAQALCTTEPEEPGEPELGAGLARRRQPSAPIPISRAGRRPRPRGVSPQGHGPNVVANPSDLVSMQAISRQFALEGERGGGGGDGDGDGDAQDGGGDEGGDDARVASTIPTPGELDGTSTLHVHRLSGPAAQGRRHRARGRRMRARTLETASGDERPAVLRGPRLCAERARSACCACRPLAHWPCALPPPHPTRHVPSSLALPQAPLTLARDHADLVSAASTAPAVYQPSRA